MVLVVSVRMNSVRTSLAEMIEALQALNSRHLLAALSAVDQKQSLVADILALRLALENSSLQDQEGFSVQLLLHVCFKSSVDHLFRLDSQVLPLVERQEVSQLSLSFDFKFLILIVFDSLESSIMASLFVLIKLELLLRLLRSLLRLLNNFLWDVGNESFSEQDHTNNDVL